MQAVKTRDVTFVNRKSMPDVDLREIHRGIEADDHMRHPSRESLERSYAEGMAVAMVDRSEGTNVAVGYVRLSERLGSDLYRSIGLEAANLPKVYEIGSGFVLGEYRGGRHYPGMRNSLLQLHRREITQGSMLVVGITNNVQVVKALGHAEKIGVSFDTGTMRELHEGYEMTTQFFCNCNPHPQIKIMIQIPGCTSQPTPQYTIESEHPDKNGSMPYYTVYWSNQSLMRRLDDRLRQSFGGRSGLRSALEDVNYYV